MPQSHYTARIILDNGQAIEFQGPADITKEQTEAIVNAANSSLLGGGGVDGAIHRAGGPSILAECKKIVAEIGSLPAGQAVITTAGRLSAKYVVHTVGPIYGVGDRDDQETLAKCHLESIRLADEHGAASIAFPAISTGAYGYPPTEAAPVAISAAIRGLKSASQLKVVRFVLFDRMTLQDFISAAKKLRDPQTSSPYKIEMSPQ